MLYRLRWEVETAYNVLKNKIAEERYHYKMNVNAAVGLIKSCFMKSVMIMARKEVTK